MAEGKWQVGAHEVTASPMPNGKVAIRANGRIVAPPMSPEDAESVFALGDVRVRIHRDAGGSLQLESERIVVEPKPKLTLQTTVGTLTDELRVAIVAGAFALVALLLLVSIEMFSNSLAVSMRFLNDPEIRSAGEPAAQRVVMIVMVLFGSARGELVAAVLLLIAAFSVWRRARGSDRLLQVAAWGPLVPAVYGMLIADRIYHVQFCAVLPLHVADENIGAVHARGIVTLLILVLVAGGLLQLVQQMRIREIVSRPSSALPTSH